MNKTQQRFPIRIQAKKDTQEPSSTQVVLTKDYLACNWAFASTFVDAGPAFVPKVHAGLIQFIVDVYDAITHGIEKEGFVDILGNALQQVGDSADSKKQADMVRCLCENPFMEVSIAVFNDFMLPHCQYWLSLRDGNPELFRCLLGGKLQATAIKMGVAGNGLFDWTTTRVDGSFHRRAYDCFAPKAMFYPLEHNIHVERVCPHEHTYDEAARLLNKWTNGLLGWLLHSPHLVVAGGLVKKAILGMQMGKSDIDVWFVGLDTESEMHDVLAQAIDIIRKHNGVQKEMIVSCKFSTVTVKVDKFEIQFPMRAYKSAEQLMLSFDFMTVQAAFDGKKFCVSEGFEYSIHNNICVIDPTMSTQGRRALKQAQEGFKVCGPFTPDLRSGLELLLEPSSLLTPGELNTVVRLIMKRDRGTMTSLMALGVCKKDVTLNSRNQVSPGVDTIGRAERELAMAELSVLQRSTTDHRANAELFMAARAAAEGVPYDERERMTMVTVQSFNDRNRSIHEQFVEGMATARRAFDLAVAEDIPDKFNPKISDYQGDATALDQRMYDMIRGKAKLSDPAARMYATDEVYIDIRWLKANF
jgi:hypothetical protein